MKRTNLMRTNLLVCLIIIAGFALTAAISYQSNRGAFEDEMEDVTRLAAAGIAHEIDSIFAKPINISLTMANDSLLKDLLGGEEGRGEDAPFLETMRHYLESYREKYGYDSVFLASAATGAYYHTTGLDRVLAQDDPEDRWFYDFLDAGVDFAINIDNDEASGNEITVFINARIAGPEGAALGVVGVGFRVDHLQALLREYDERFDLQASLVAPDGTLEISSEQTGFQETRFFDTCAYPQHRDAILAGDEEPQELWYTGGYLVSRYISGLGWFLIVDHDTSALDARFYQQLLGAALVVALVIILVLMTITRIYRAYSAQVVRLTVAREQEHKTLYQAAAEELYEDIYEVDVTHDRAASPETDRYFESLGAPPHTPYSRALRIVAEQQIKEEFRKAYLDTFLPEPVLAAFRAGTKRLECELMISTDGAHYYWMRITAILFRWEEDGSVRLLIYRQNIDAKKRRELYLMQRMEEDAPTGLYNKAATINRVRCALEAGGTFALFILDIDDFKTINDRYGHAAGDQVLSEFARTLREQFRGEGVVGRIGGDEFAAFLPVQDRAAAECWAWSLSAALRREMDLGRGPFLLTASIGGAVAPEAGTDYETLFRHADAALYETKGREKDGFTIYRAEGAEVV